MSPNKQTVETYIDGFNKSDHAQILSCLTDGIEWTVFGYFRLRGKEAYDREIENPAFVGSPTVTITRMSEDIIQIKCGAPTGETRAWGCS